MSAQTFEEFRNEKKAEFDRFRKEKQTEFEQYRQRLNEEYAAFLNSKWETFKAEPAKEPAMKPKPSTPETAKKDQNTTPRNLKISKVISPEPKIQDVPVTLPKVSEVRKTYPVNFSFFNTQCGIDKFDTSQLSNTKTDNASLTSAWQQLTANERLTPLVEDCLRLREELRLCDWGYLLLVEKVAATLYPHSTDNQAFLTVAILNQSGYDSRIGIRGEHLGVLFHPSHQIYGQLYWPIDGKDYYLLGDINNLDAPLHSYHGDYRKSPTPIRLTLDRYPLLTPREALQRRFSSSSWHDAPPFDITVNSSVIDFLNTYPLVDWPLYGTAPISPELKSVLWPAMSILTEGMDEVEAVNLLLAFHNYAFQYKTDGDQFGREKPFFFDENYYYPYNDCEDRAIMFAKLVNSILGLDVVYLKYPKHLAAAVCFSPGRQIKGAYVEVDGRKYYVCDPTCIGAKAGYLAGIFSTSTPEVYK
ncbi:MAG: hypothetical protein K2K05_09630, partial [Muribaculaceae bacterium]|nr:hypothetical protein [Muribaculaceae bacterium]